MESSASVTMDQPHCLRVPAEHPPLWTGGYPGFFPNFKVTFCVLFVHHCYISLLGNKFFKLINLSFSTYIPVILLRDVIKKISLPDLSKWPNFTFSSKLKFVRISQTGHSGSGSGYFEGAHSILAVMGDCILELLRFQERQWKGIFLPVSPYLSIHWQFREHILSDFI